VKSVVLSILIAAVAASGCATKKYVSREVGEVNQKVEVLTGEMEKTQERVKRSEVRIDEVGKDVQDVRGQAQTALTRATEAERAAKGKLIYTVTISNDQVTFPVNRSEVSDEAKQIVDEAIAQLKAENRGVFFEIEGHTDSSGPDDYNVRLGYDRAVAVRNYMHDQHEIALNRIEVISYGESKPVEDNKTKINRAKNRRVVIRVLE
jgi:peptidoglycan-associated lipoprotein